MLSRLPEFKPGMVILFVSVLVLTACATEQPLVDGQAIEPSFQEKVTDCSKIADRGERNRCLYDN